MRGFWKRPAEKGSMFVATSEKGSGRREVRAHGNTGTSRALLLHPPPGHCGGSSRTAVIPEMWLPFAECCPLPGTKLHAILGLIPPNSHQNWCFYHHPHLADEEVDLERVSDLPRSHTTSARAQGPRANLAGSKGARTQSKKVARAYVLARWVVAGTALWSH